MVALPARIFHIWHDRAVFHFLTAECNQFCHPLLRDAATKCNGTLPPSTITKVCANIIRAEGVRRRSRDSIRTRSKPGAGE